MAIVRRTSVLRKMQDLSGMQTAAESLPNQLANIINPVLHLNPSVTTLVRHSGSTTTGNVTVYGTPLDKDFFLTFITLSITKDVLCDNNAVNVQSVIDGGARVLLTINTQTLTAGSQTATISFPYPIKLDRNAGITLVGAFAAGSMTKTVCIGGYILE